MLNPEFYLSLLEKLYGEYLETVEGLERSRKFGEGMFGFKGGPADSPCHDRFAEDIKALLDDFAGRQPPSAATRGMLEYIYEAPKKHPNPKSAYWMLIAVQGLTRELIGALGKEDAAALAERFSEMYPRYEQVPVQIELLKDLQRAGGVSPRRAWQFWKK